MFVLLENVKGFEMSSVRQDILDALLSRGFQCQEFLLSPDQVRSV